MFLAFNPIDSIKLIIFDNMHLRLRFCSHLIALASMFVLIQAPISSQAAGEKKLEVFSWWTSGGEAAALDALFNVYKKQ